MTFAPHGEGDGETGDSNDGDSNKNAQSLTTVGTLEQLELRRLHTMRHTYREMMRRRKRWVRHCFDNIGSARHLIFTLIKSSLSSP